MPLAEVNRGCYTRGGATVLTDPHPVRELPACEVAKQYHNVGHPGHADRHTGEHRLV